MAIEQIRAEHSLAEDRILLLLRTSEQEEYKLWLTRRVTLFLLAATEHLIGVTLSKKFEHDTAKAISSFQKDSTKQETDFNASYTGGTQFPIGDSPKLVKDMRCSVIEIEGQMLIKLDIEFEAEKNITITLLDKSMRQMCMLVENISKNAHWLAQEQSPTPNLGDQANPEVASQAAKKLH
jgi:hypothetical protein